MIVYATNAELVTWIGSEPDTDDVDRMLRQASILVGRACRNDLYDTVPSGKPSDDDLAAAMRDATCAQVEQWIEAGVTAVAAGAAGIAMVKTETTVDGATWKYDPASVAAATQARIDSTIRLCTTALAVLRNVGLASGLV
ncbi:hypothetical protein [Gordonia insulae]|uniref:Uncharacterized protein n=1 Tax=Gordonia insulae TaxID=2420509 RepID=A0A3G8JEW7_9ACTN|nr:hypothetical protein [Gordonia insulae]AZG43448.1 hypothetical protein D7316_00012 [Gordonia insulae]